MFDVEQAADELDESILNQNLSDEEIAEKVYMEDTTGAYRPDRDEFDGRDDVEAADIDRVRRHLEIVEADMRHFWDSTVQYFDDLPEGSTDDYVIFYDERRVEFVRPIFEHEVDEEADYDVLVYLLGEITTKLRGRDDAWSDMVLPLPDDVTLEDVEELVNL